MKDLSFSIFWNISYTSLFSSIATNASESLVIQSDFWGHSVTSQEAFTAESQGDSLYYSFGAVWLQILRADRILHADFVPYAWLDKIEYYLCTEQNSSSARETVGRAVQVVSDGNQQRQQQQSHQKTSAITIKSSSYNRRRRVRALVGDQLVPVYNSDYIIGL